MIIYLNLKTMKASHKIIVFIIVVFLILPACLYVFNYMGSKKEVTHIASVFNSERCLNRIPTLVMRGKKANRGMSFASDSRLNGHSVELNIMPGSVSLQNDTLVIDLSDESDVYQGRVLLNGLTTVIRNGHRYLIDNGLITWPIDTMPFNVNVLAEDKLSQKLRVVIPTEVIAPTSGIIDELSYEYLINGMVVTETFDKADNVDSVARSMSDFTGSKIMPDKLHLSVSLVDNKGYKVNIRGLQPHPQLRTGKKIVKGEILGVTSDSLITIYAEHNGVQISAKDYLNNSLPMGRKGNEYIKNPTTCNLTASQMEEDIKVLIESYRECFPFWTEHVSSEDIECTVTEILTNLPDTLSSNDIKIVMDRLNALLHDSHIFYNNSSNSPEDMYYHDIEFGLEHNKVIVTLATKKYSKYLKSEIKTVDGISSDSVVRFGEKFIGGYDMNVQDYPKNLLFGILTQLYCRYHPSKQKEKNFELTLTTGEKIQVESHKGMPDLKEFQPDRSQYLKINRHNNQRYKVEILHDSIAYIGLSTFDLYDTDLDSLVGLMCDNRFSTMIFDLRNNPGGSSKVADKLIKTACGEVFPWNNQQSIINKRRGFNAFKHSLNYTMETPVVGNEFIKDQNSDKFVCKRNVLVSPSDTLQCHINSFFIILNEISGSSASYFASALHRSGRALIIGREPRTAYHHMTALKYCKLQLPNSGVIWHIPLVREIFDTNTLDNIPLGRGVLPDIYIPLTFDEVAFNNGDELRKKTIEAALTNNIPKIDSKWIFLLFSLICILVAIIWKIRNWRK